MTEWFAFAILVGYMMWAMLKLERSRRENIKHEDPRVDG